MESFLVTQYFTARRPFSDDSIDKLRQTFLEAGYAVSDTAEVRGFSRSDTYEQRSTLAFKTPERTNQVRTDAPVIRTPQTTNRPARPPLRATIPLAIPLSRSTVARRPLVEQSPTDMMNIILKQKATISTLRNNIRKLHAQIQRLTAKVFAKYAFFPTMCRFLRPGPTE